MWAKYIFNLLVLLIFSVSSTGFVIYEHYCTKSGQSSHYFSEVNNVCSNEDDSCEIAEESTCCSKNDAKEDIGLEENCCSTDLSFFQLNSDYSFTNSNEFFKATNLAYSVLHDRTPFERKSFSALALRAPPPKINLPLSRKIAFLQVYRI